jgi:hypothetical protein
LNAVVPPPLLPRVRAAHVDCPTGAGFGLQLELMHFQKKQEKKQGASMRRINNAPEVRVLRGVISIFSRRVSTRVYMVNILNNKASQLKYLSKHQLQSLFTLFNCM